LIADGQLSALPRAAKVLFQRNKKAAATAALNKF
jgi:hypothetical protein